MRLRQYRVVSSDDEDESEEDNNDNSLPSTSRSAKKRRLLKQSGLKTDSAFGQSLSDRLNTDPANSRKTRHLKKNGAEVKGKRCKSNIRRVCEDSDFREDECGFDSFGCSFSRKNKGDKRIRRQSTEPYQSPKKNKWNKKSSNGHKWNSKVGSTYYEEGAEDVEGTREVKKQLEEEFEPSALEDSYMTAKDNRIKAVDIAERLQLLEESLGPLSPKGQQSREAEWIYDRAFGHLAMPMHKEIKYISELSRQDVIHEIEFLLIQLHDNKLEIPFIGKYRKEGCIGLLHKKKTGSLLDIVENDELDRYEALWQVFFWDKRWHLLQRRKYALREEYLNRATSQSCKNAIMGDLLDRLLSLLQEAESDQGVNDIDAKFNLYFPPEVVKLLEGQYKRPRRQSYYSICCNSGLGDFAKHFGLSPEQLGENVQSMQKIHEVCDCSSTLEDVAMRYCTTQLGDSYAALKGARHMIASEISSEPAIKKYARKIFSEQAVVNTILTQKGHTLIDNFHEYGFVKQIRTKPVIRFDNGEWLLIQRAEEEDLLEVTVKLNQENIDGLIHDLQARYLSVNSSREAEVWNEHRKEILRDAVFKMLLPCLEKETRMLLTARAKAWVQKEYVNELWKKVSVSPYRCSNESLTDSSPRVLACCCGPINSATFVMLDSHGNILSMLQTGYLNLYGGSYEQNQRKVNDQQRLLKVLVEYRPDVVVLGARNLACRHLKDAILETVQRLESENSLSSVSGWDGISVVYGDESLPSLFEKSLVSREQLPGQPDIVRRAVALGRYLLNPLAMVASLCTPRREIVALKLHCMQSFLSTDEVYDAVEQVMITVTNQVGVDLNLAASHEWLFGPLQFVSGLGPRKASSLQHSIQLAGWIYSRKELMTRPISMGQNVFLNSSGFLRIRKVGYTVHRTKEMNPLDDTRIHPEAYEFACNLAIHLYSSDQRHKQADIDEVLLENAIHHIRQHPDLLMDFNVMDFRQSIGVEVGEETLKVIRRELLHGFRESRVPYVQPTQDEEFTWLSGEDEKSLAKGRIVNATARKIYQNRVMCVLESGIWGILQREDMAIEDGSDLSNVISEGTILTCQVAHVQKEKFLVELTCKGNNLDLENWQDIDGKDEPNSQNVLPSDADQDKARTEEAREKYFRPRLIAHPLFQNISRADAVKALLDKKLGDVIFHPSRKGPSCLSMTLKFYDNVYVHKELLEDKKDTKDLAGFLRLGNILKLGDKTFRNLQEVVTCYVDPLIKNLKEITGSEMFRCGSDQEIKAFLHQNVKLHSGSFVYCFSICHRSPGAIKISYLRDMVVHNEDFDLHPGGYQFQQQIFDNIGILVNYFKSIALAPVNVGNRASHRLGWSKFRGSCGKSQDHWNSRARFDSGFKHGVRQDGATKKWDKSKEDKRGNRFFGVHNGLTKQGEQWGTLKDKSLNCDPMKSQAEIGWSPEDGSVEGNTEKDSGWDFPSDVAATNGWGCANEKHAINEPGNFEANRTDEPAVGGQAAKDSGWDFPSDMAATTGWESTNGKHGINEPGNIRCNGRDEPAVEGQAPKDSGWDFPSDMVAANVWESTNRKHVTNEPRNSRDNGIDEHAVKGRAEKDSEWDFPSDMDATNGWGDTNGKHVINEPGNLWGNATDDPTDGGGKFSLGSCRLESAMSSVNCQDHWNSNTTFDSELNHVNMGGQNRQSSHKSRQEIGRHQDCWNSTSTLGSELKDITARGRNEQNGDKSRSGKGGRYQFVESGDRFGRGRESVVQEGKSYGLNVMKPQPGSDWPVKNTGNKFCRRVNEWGRQKDENCGWNTTKLQGESRLPPENDGIVCSRRDQVQDMVRDESFCRDTKKSQSEAGWPIENYAIKLQAAGSDGWDSPPQMASVDDWNNSVKDGGSGYSRNDEGCGMAKDESCGWDTKRIGRESRLPIENDGPGLGRRGEAWDAVKDEGRNAPKSQSETGWALEDDATKHQEAENDGWDIPSQMDAMDNWGCLKNTVSVCESTSTWEKTTDRNADSRMSHGAELFDAAPAKRQDPWISNFKTGKGFNTISRSGTGSVNGNRSQEKGGQYQSTGRCNGFGRRGRGRGLHRGGFCSGDPMEHGWSRGNFGTENSRRGQGWNTPRRGFCRSTGEFQLDSGWGSRNNNETKQVTKDDGWDGPPKMTEVDQWDLVTNKNVVNDFASTLSNATDCPKVQTARSFGLESSTELAGRTRLNVVKESENQVTDTGKMQTEDSGWDSTDVGGWDTVGKKNVVDDSSSSLSKATDCIRVQTPKTVGGDSSSELPGINQFSMKEKNNIDESGNPWTDMTEVQTEDRGWNNPPEITEVDGWDTNS